MHLREMGMTYAQASAAAIAQPTNQHLSGLVQTLFRGETLRGLLLNAWGWWTVGTYALFAAIVLTVATAATFLALIFEAVFAPRRVGVPMHASVSTRPSTTR